jgi:hypothetical protein
VFEGNLKQHIEKLHNTCNENVQGEAMNTKKKCGAKKAKYKKGVEGKFGCGFCGKSFSKNCNLKLHQEFHHKSKNFKCTMCNSSFKKKSLLKMHIERNHASEKSESKPCNESKAILVNNEYGSFGEETGSEETMKANERNHASEKSESIGYSNGGQALTKVEYWSSGEETIEDIKDIFDSFFTRTPVFYLG